MTNDAIANAPWPFVNKDGETDFAIGQFFEGGINLSDMFGGEPPCFGTFLAETRSSQETDAQLKDFALGSLDTCVPPDIETHVQQNGQNVSSINKGESVVDVATFSGDNGEVTGTVEFFVCGPGQSKPDCSTGGTQVGGTETIANEIGHLGLRSRRPAPRLVLLPRRIHARPRAPSTSRASTPTTPPSVSGSSRPTSRSSRRRTTAPSPPARTSASR